MVRDVIVTKVSQESTGRFVRWSEVVDDWKSIKGNRPYALTGVGAGSFKYVHVPRVGGDYRQAHNEYLEILYNFGIVGLGLFLAAVGSMIKYIFSNEYRVNDLKIKVCAVSLLCISLCACGTFVWQIGTMAFYSVVLVGLIYNKDGIYGLG